MYKFITCPETGNVYTVSSKKGERVIMGYANFILKQTGGGDPSTVPVDYSDSLKGVRDLVVNELFKLGYNNYDNEYIPVLIGIINKIDSSADNIDAIREFMHEQIVKVSSKDKLQPVTAFRHFYMSQMTNLYEKLDNPESVDSLKIVAPIAYGIEDEVAEELDENAGAEAETTRRPSEILDAVIPKTSDDTLIDQMVDSTKYPTLSRDILRNRLTLIRKALPWAKGKLLQIALERELELSPKNPSRFLQCFLDETCLYNQDRANKPGVTNEALPPGIMVGGAAAAAGDAAGDAAKIEALKWGIMMYRVFSLRGEPAHDFPSLRNLKKTIGDIIKSKVGGKTLGGFKDRLRLFPRNPLKLVMENPLRLNSKSGKDRTITGDIDAFLKNTFIGVGVEKNDRGRWQLTKDTSSGDVGTDWCRLDCISGSFEKVFCANLPIPIDPKSISFNKFIYTTGVHFKSNDYLLDIMKPTEHEAPTFNILHNNRYTSETGVLIDENNASELRKFNSQFHYFIDYGVDAQQSFILFLEGVHKSLFYISKIISGKLLKPAGKEAARRDALSSGITRKLEYILNQNNIVNYTMDCTLGGSLSRSTLSIKAAKKIWEKNARAGDSLFALTSTLRKSNTLNYIVPITNAWDPAPGGINPNDAHTLGKGINLKSDNTILYDSFRESSRRIFFLRKDLDAETDHNIIHIWYNKARVDWFNISPKYFNKNVQEKYPTFDESYTPFPDLNLESGNGRGIFNDSTYSEYIGNIETCPGVDNLILLRYLNSVYFEELKFWYGVDPHTSVTDLYKWVEDLNTFTEADNNVLNTHLKKTQYSSRKKVVQARIEAAFSKKNAAVLPTKGAVDAETYINSHINTNFSVVTQLSKMVKVGSLPRPLDKLEKNTLTLLRKRAWNVVYAFLMQAAGGKTRYDNKSGQNYKNRTTFTGLKEGTLLLCTCNPLNNAHKCTSCVSNPGASTRLKGGSFVFLKLISKYIEAGMTEIEASLPPDTKLKYLEELEKSVDLFLLDIKKSGDYSQVKLDRMLNILNPDRQTIHIVNDRLAGLAAIANETHVMVGGKIIEFSETHSALTEQLEAVQTADRPLVQAFKKLIHKGKGIIFGERDYQIKGESNRYTSLVVYTNNNSIMGIEDQATQTKNLADLKQIIRGAHVHVDHTTAGDRFLTWIYGNTVTPRYTFNMEDSTTLNQSPRAVKLRELVKKRCTPSRKASTPVSVEEEAEVDKAVRDQVAARVILHAYIQKEREKKIKGEYDQVAANKLLDTVLGDDTVSVVETILPLIDPTRRDDAPDTRWLTGVKKKLNKLVAEARMHSTTTENKVNKATKQRHATGIKNILRKTKKGIERALKSARQTGGATQSEANMFINKFVGHYKECAQKELDKVRSDSPEAAALNGWVNDNNEFIKLELEDFMKILYEDFPKDIESLGVLGRDADEAPPCAGATARPTSPTPLTVTLGKELQELARKEVVTVLGPNPTSDMCYCARQILYGAESLALKIDKMALPDVGAEDIMINRNGNVIQSYFTAISDESDVDLNLGNWWHYDIYDLTTDEYNFFKGNRTLLNPREWKEISTLSDLGDASGNYIYSSEEIEALFKTITSEVVKWNKFLDFLLNNIRRLKIPCDKVESSREVVEPVIASYTDLYKKLYSDITSLSDHYYNKFDSSDNITILNNKIASLDTGVQTISGHALNDSYILSIFLEQDREANIVHALYDALSFLDTHSGIDISGTVLLQYLLEDISGNFDQIPNKLLKLEEYFNDFDTFILDKGSFLLEYRWEDTECPEVQLYKNIITSHFAIDTSGHSVTHADLEKIVSTSRNGTSYRPSPPEGRGDGEAVDAVTKIETDVGEAFGGLSIEPAIVRLIHTELKEIADRHVDIYRVGLDHIQSLLPPYTTGLSEPSVALVAYYYYLMNILSIDDEE